MPEEQLKQVVNVVRSPQYRAVYVNHATGGISNWEIHFTLGTLGETSPGQAAVEEQVMLMMTYEFAKAMQATFAVAIQAYESRSSTVSTTQPLPLQSLGSEKMK